MIGSWILPLASGEGGLLSAETGLVVWMSISFVILLFIMKSKGWGPIVAAMAAREEKIRTSLAAAEEARAEAAQQRQKQDAERDAGRREAEKILEEARRDAKALQDKARSVAQSEAEEIKARALKEIELAKAKAIEDMRQGSVDLAMTLASRVLQAEVDGGRHKALVDDFISSWEQN